MIYRHVIAKSLRGNWRTEHLFALKQALGGFDFVRTQLAECDGKIEIMAVQWVLFAESEAVKSPASHRRTPPQQPCRSEGRRWQRRPGWT